MKNLTICIGRHTLFFVATAFFLTGCSKTDVSLFMPGEWSFKVGFDSTQLSGAPDSIWKSIAVPGSFPQDDSVLRRHGQIMVRHALSPCANGDSAHCFAVALRTGRASDTARFFINTAAICSSGTSRPFIAGLDRESIIPIPNNMVPKFPGSYLYIVYSFDPTSRFHGVRIAPVFGNSVPIYRKYLTELVLTFFTLGVFFAVSLYFIILGLLRLKDRHILDFGLLTLAFIPFVSVNTIIKDSLFFLRGPLDEKVDLCAGIATIAFFALFITRLISKRLVKIPAVAILLLGVLFLSALFTRGTALSLLRLGWYVVCIAFLPYFLWYVVNHAIKGSRDARIVTAGLIVFMIAGIHDLLAFYGYVPFFFSMPYAFSFFIAVMTALLSRNFVSVYNGMELLNETLDRRVRERTEELEDLNRQKDRMLGVIAHDLNNPIAAILVTAELMEIGLKNGEIGSIGEQLPLIKQACTQADATIKDVLADARRREAAIDEKRARVNLSSLLVPVAALCKVRARGKGVRFRDEIPQTGISVHVNSDAIARVVDNLLSNAVKFTPRNGSVTLTLESWNGVARIMVVDTGIGIPPELKSSIFERFTLAGRSGTEREASTGLGLSIASDIVRKNGGTILVESEVGKGSTFTVEFSLSD
jgi:signal transduction histidine kinase